MPGKHLPPSTYSTAIILIDSVKMRSRTSKKLIDYGSVAFCVLLIICYFRWNRVDEDTPPTEPTDYKSAASTNFEDVSKAQIRPEDGKNVFFTETGESTENVELNARQACALESAAIAYPDSKIYLLYTSEERLNNLQKSSAFVYAVTSYSNVHINHLNLAQFAAGSPLEDLSKSEYLRNSSYRAIHTSDTLKWLLLWKFGGIYFDSDMIIRKRFSPGIYNFACKQTEGEVTSGVLGFESRPQGKYLLDIFIKVFLHDFNNYQHEVGGPIITSNAVRRLCDAKIEDVGATDCQEFYVLESKYCYPIPWIDWGLLFGESPTDETMQKLGEANTVHFWGTFSNAQSVNINSKAPYAQLAREFCPKVAAAITGSF